MVDRPAAMPGVPADLSPPSCHAPKGRTIIAQNGGNPVYDAASSAMDHRKFA
jgi:hypothetical protein